MNFFRDALTYYLKRPIIFIYFSIIAFVISIIGLFNPLSSLLKMYDRFITESVTDTIVLLSKEVYKIGVIPYIALGILLISIFMGILSGVFTSGYFYLIYKSVIRSKASKTDIIDGVKKYFIKVSYVFFEFYLVFLGFLAVTPLVIVPSVIIAKKAIENNTTTFLNTGLLSLVTGFVIVVISLLIIVHFAYKIPGLYFFGKKPIEKSKYVLASSYWSVFGKVSLFVIVFVMGGYLIFSINVPIVVALLNWIFGTIAIGLFTIFIFYDYSLLLSKFKKKQENK